VKPAVIDMPWCGGDWVRLGPAQPPRPALVELSGATRLPPSSRQAKARASVAILCPAEKAAPAEPPVLSETDAQRRARQAKAAIAGWT